MHLIKISLTIGLVTCAVSMHAAASIVTNEEVDQPNILWLTSEDNNVNWVGCYGNPNSDTPNIDQLAVEGFQYMNAFASAPVCAPSRSTWITGINAVSMGTHPMRSRNEIPHDHIKYYPDFLREAGYYCSNDKKTDYNIGGRKDQACWDSMKTDWKALQENQPFFQVINNTESHESHAKKGMDDTVHDPADVTLYQYHPDIPVIRQNYALYHDAVKRMDDGIGKALKALEKAGLAENTIVIYCSDHGGVLPRSKRFLYDSGAHSPFIVRIPEKYKHLWPAEETGAKIDRLVSYVDMPKTWLSIVGAEVPQYMQGAVFLGAASEPEQKYHHSFRGRMDERNDNVRAVRDKQYLYIKNYMPYAPYGQHLQYHWEMPAVQAWEQYHNEGKTDAITGRFFKKKAYTEEFYDTKRDPDNVNNLIESPEYSVQINEMRVSLRSWQEEVFDAGLLPEADMVKLAADHGTTIYEMVRNPQLYNLGAYLDASDLALSKNDENLPAFVEFMKDSDTGIQYWGIVGCFMLDDQAATAKEEILKLLNNDSHEVRAMAAWTLINLGEKDQGLACLESLLKGQSYATLKVLNIIDWMGDEGETLIPSLKVAKRGRDILKMQNYLCSKFGVAPAEKKRAKGKKRAKKKVK